MLDPDQLFSQFPASEVPRACARQHTLFQELRENYGDLVRGVDVRENFDLCCGICLQLAPKFPQAMMIVRQALSEFDIAA